MKLLKFLYRKWIKKECPHVCRWCKFNVNKKYCIEELCQERRK